jgi:hypothetical protein
MSLSSELLGIIRLDAKKQIGTQIGYGSATVFARNVPKDYILIWIFQRVDAGQQGYRATDFSSPCDGHDNPKPDPRA